MVPVVNERRAVDLEKTISSINNLEVLPDVVIHTGDIVHNGSDEEYLVASSLLKKLKPPLFVVPGNRDVRFNLRKAFPTEFYDKLDDRFVQYVIECFPVRILMLDTVNLGGNKGEFCLERINNLKMITEKKSSKPTFVFMHHPPFETLKCPDPFQFQDNENMLRLRIELSRVKNLKYIFCGHVHRFESGCVETIPVSCVPSIATDLRWGKYSFHQKDRPLYQLHKFHSDHGVLSQTKLV